MPKSIGPNIRKQKMVKTKDYQDYLIKSLKDSKEAAAYLNAALEEAPKVFLLALRNVVEAWGGIGAVSKKTKLNRENLYKMLSKKGNPALYSLENVLKALGLKLSVEVETLKKGT